MVLNRKERVDWKMILPYVHEAERSNVGGVCVGDQTHQLFASQLECKQFIQQTESSRDNATSPDSSYLKDKHKTHHCTPHKTDTNIQYSIKARWITEPTNTKTLPSSKICNEPGYANPKGSV